MPAYLTGGEGRELLRVARAHLEARVRRTPAPPVRAEGTLARPAGAFVTITRGEELRGCLGRIEADRPLAETVAHLAGVVAVQDYRFSPVRAQELPELTVEVSVLTPPETVPDLGAIEVGRHGLIVEQGRAHGLLLPQVASERGWDRETFLAQTCLKAGLPPDAWRHGARVLWFEAQVLTEPGKAEGRT